jgi:signal transduction histidine kinase
MRGFVRGLAAVVPALVAGVVDLMLWFGDNELRNGDVAPMWVVPMATVVAVALLVVRRRWPRAVFWVLWAYGLAGVLMPYFAPFAVLLLALQNLAARRPLRISGVALAACVVPLGINTVNTAMQVDPEYLLVTTSITAVTWVILAVGSFAVGRSMWSADRRAELLRELGRRDAQQARQSERLRLARDLHDVVAHGVSEIVLHAAGTRSDPRSDVPAALRHIERTGVRAMEELGEMLGLLRTSAPGVGDVERLVADARAGGMFVALQVEGEPLTLSEETDRAAYRVIQEGLTNARKHGGPRCHVEILCRWVEGAVTISVRSIARSTSAGGVEQVPALPSSGHGLRGLAERVHEAGGALQSGPRPEGFLLQAELPVPAR